MFVFLVVSFNFLPSRPQVMGGRNSPDFKEYQRQCVQALLVARKHAKQVKVLMEIMTYHSSYPAFRYSASYIFLIISILLY